jgi:hypothetical protein
MLAIDHLALHKQAKQWGLDTKESALAPFEQLE